MTEGEQRLWQELRDFRRLYGIHVRKQVPVGKYVADFAIHSHKLIIEVDGHFHEQTDRIKTDKLRDNWLRQAGYRVLRFKTGELDSQRDGCIEEILRELGLVN